MRSTNYARASYQEVYDIMTRDGKVSIFAFHTPTGDAPYNMLHGFFTQFRKYRYGGMKVNVIPAAQLPADPLQISYEAGTESYIDPRDLQNPVLFHGVHGNNLGEVLNMIYAGPNSVSDGTADYLEADAEVGPDEASRWSFESWYYASMLDPSFRKFSVMNNMSLPFMRPLVHGMATDMAIQPSYYPANDFVIDSPEISSNATTGDVSVFKDVNPIVPDLAQVSIPNYRGVPVNVISNRMTKLGWLDTFTMAKGNTLGATQGENNYPTVSPLPKIMMGAMIVPPSYRTRLAFRVVINHFFEFARFNTSITPTLVQRPVTINAQYFGNYHDYLPAELTASVSEANSIDSLDGDVHQSVSGIV